MYLVERWYNGRKGTLKEFNVERGRWNVELYDMQIISFSTGINTAVANGSWLHVTPAGNNCMIKNY